MEVEVRVYATVLDWNNSQPALVKRVAYGDLLIPWDRMVDTFKCLFGKDCAVVFVVL